MLNTILRAKLHGSAFLAPLAAYLTNSAAKVALLCALAIPTIGLGHEHYQYKLIDLGTLGGAQSYVGEGDASTTAVASFTTLVAHLTVPRSRHTATRLTSGKVLITGGANGIADDSAELYDPTTDTFIATVGRMNEARINHTATLLNDTSLANYGKVLIVGSVDESAELYNPSTETFKATGRMHHARTSPTATLLSHSGPNAGKVLIVGGNSTPGDRVAELYDPATGTFSNTGSTTILRIGHTATLLTIGALAGHVLIAGGNGTATAEIYNPATGAFTLTGSMTEPRTGHTATALSARDGAQNGDVLIVGVDGSADLFHTSTAKFTAVGSYANGSSITSTRTASLRNDGTVLVAGGFSPVPVYKLVITPPPLPHVFCAFLADLPLSVSAAGLFASESDGFTAAGFLNTSRDGHTATLLPDGSVLVIGGTHHSISRHSFSFCSNPPPTEVATVLSSAELFK